MDNYNRAVIAGKNSTNDKKKVNLRGEGKLVHSELDMIAIQDADGRFFEGYTDDFSPTIPFFHLFQTAEKFNNERQKIYFDNIKLIYFIRSVVDNSFHNGDTCIPPSGPTTEVTFKDGEVLQGIKIDSRPNGFGFFILTNQNNITRKVFMVDTAIQKIRDLQ
jgi:hypothetical protein